MRSRATVTVNILSTITACQSICRFGNGEALCPRMICRSIAFFYQTYCCNLYDVNTAEDFSVRAVCLGHFSYSIV